MDLFVEFIFTLMGEIIFEGLFIFIKNNKYSLILRMILFTIIFGSLIALVVLLLCLSYKEKLIFIFLAISTIILVIVYLYQMIKLYKNRKV